jgi:D-3-phosphoglycerate dehydrogenase / 2-oxoglutarate reductase
MEYRVLVSDAVHEEGLARFAARAGFRVDVHVGVDPEALKDLIGSYHALVIRSGTKVTEDILDSARDLKVVGRAGSGVDNVDVAAATRRGIVVMNTPGGNSMSTAEHTLAMIMAAHRHIPQATASMKMGKWEKKKFQGREMSGKTLGVVGLGRIGGLVSMRARRGLKLDVIGYDPATTAQAASQIGVKLVPLEELFARADIITVHTPLSTETRGLVGERAFNMMKDGVIIINCARGGIVDEAALLGALESGKVAAAALDDFTSGPPGPSPLIAHPRVIATPHLGASTREAQIDVAVQIAEQIIDYLEKGIIRNAVNVHPLDSGQAARLGPYLDLAKRLAQFLGKLTPEGMIEMEVEYRGEIAAWDIKPLTNAALVGLLSRYEGTEVNEVNAPVIARERGIRVLETTAAETARYGPSLVIRIRCADGTCSSVQGALIERVGYEPRIIGIDHFVTEAVPAGTMLIVTNRDIPGMIAGVSGTLAGSGINIAQMNLSRESVGGKALSIINLDSPAEEVTLNAIRNIDGILSVKQVVLDQ